MIKGENCNTTFPCQLWDKAKAKKKQWEKESEKHKREGREKKESCTEREREVLKTQLFKSSHTQSRSGKTLCERFFKQPTQGVEKERVKKKESEG